MLFKGLSIIRDELQAYIQLQGDPTALVVLENIALLDSGNDTDLIKDKIIISLVNIEEESSLKNVKNFRKNLNGGIDYIEPPVNLNLYLLFSVNFPGGQLPNNNYTRALTRLSNIIQFFQGRKLFSIHNSPNSTLIQNNANLDDPELTALKLTMELYTLTFEQINHLWGSLGGKQVPFVMYKARLVSIQDGGEQQASIIEEINNDLQGHP